jgi:hypothetical protein
MMNAAQRLFNSFFLPIDFFRSDYKAPHAPRGTPQRKKRRGRAGQVRW